VLAGIRNEIRYRLASEELMHATDSKPRT
jgi:hypothetical protein